MKNKFDPQVPNNNLPPLPPEAEIESKAILRQLVRSRQNLAELKGYSSLLPNRDLIVNSIVLQEAKDSSEIENIVTTSDELYRAIASPSSNIDPRVKEVFKYRTALWKGYKLVSKHSLLTSNIICEVQEELEGNRTGFRKLPGTVLANEQTGQVYYTPPDNNSIIISLMTNLEKYINETDGTDPLVRMAIMHYQFEAIHPFYDGNGRTGRIANVLYLVSKDLLDTPFLYLSRYIIRNKNDYYRLLRNVTYEQKWEEWILFMLTAVEHISRETLDLSRSIIKLMDQTGEKISKAAPRIYSHELLSLLFSNVYIRIGHLVDAGLASRNIAASYLKKCESEGILKSLSSGREILYINKSLFKLLKDFNMH
jgi:Fic family protein